MVTLKHKFKIGDIVHYSGKYDIEPKDHSPKAKVAAIYKYDGNEIAYIVEYDKGWSSTFSREIIEGIKHPESGKRYHYAKEISLAHILTEQVINNYPIW
jgi:hypothetical protein